MSDFDRNHYSLILGKEFCIMTQNADQLLELGKLYCDRGDFAVAIEKLNQALPVFLAVKDHKKYLDAVNLILRMHAERDEFPKIFEIKEQLQDLVLKDDLKLVSKTYYIFGICASYKKQYEASLDYFQKALNIALQENNREDMCYAILGIAITYKNLNKPTEALKELYNLQVFFQVLNIPEIQISALHVNGLIFLSQNKYDQALELFWQAYDLTKETKKIAQFALLLTNMGETYSLMGDHHLAKVYLDLAQKSIDPNNMVRLNMAIEDRLRELGEKSGNKFDIVFNSNEHSIVEKNLGKVDFKNQFILLDLLRLLVQNQGQVYSKEYLVQNVWKQEYDPAVHDNKIYVTIKRLRKMIEPDFDKPKYIFRAKNGYFMSKTAKVLINH